MGNEKYFFTVNGVVAVVHLSRVVPREHFGQIGIRKSYAFCLFLRQTTWAIRNVESTFRGAVDEMRCRAELSSEIRIAGNLFQGSRRAVVAKTANHAVDSRVLAKLL